MSPEQLAQEQLDAYNARDLDRFVACYADDIRLYRPPAAEPFLSGKAALAAHYAANRFNNAALHAELRGRLVVGNKVFDHERAHGRQVTGEPTRVVRVDGEVAKGRLDVAGHAHDAKTPRAEPKSMNAPCDMRDTAPNDVRE